MLTYPFSAEGGSVLWRKISQKKGSIRSLMAKYAKLVAVFVAVTLIISSPAFGYWVWSPEQGKFINPQDSVDTAAEEQFNFSMQFYKDKNYKRAENEFKNLVKTFPKSDVSAEALYFLGQVHEEQGEYFRAFKDYQKIINDYPQSERVDEVIERQFRIGDMYMTGKKEKLMGLPIKPSLSHAVEIFTKIVETSPYSAYGDQSQFRLAQAYRTRRDWRKAGEEYQKLIDNYPDSNLVDDAKFQMAECIALQASKPDRDQRALEVAAQNFDQFLQEYPDSPIAQKAAQLKESISLKAAEKNYKIGEYYEKDNYMDSAMIYYEDVARSYPGTTWAKKAEDKVQKLREPEKFLKQRASLIEAKQRDVEQRERGIAEKEAQLRYEKDPALEQTIDDEKQKIKELKKSIDTEESRFEKNKKESIKLRRKALERDKAELKRKEKVLAQKRKLLKTNPSKSLESAMERWADSLEAERYSLYRKETDIIKLEEQFGIRVGNGLLGALPLIGRREPLDSTIRYKYKDFDALTRRWEKIKKQKDEVISERQEFEARMAASGPWNLEMLRQNPGIWKKIQEENPDWLQLEKHLSVEEIELGQLEEKQEAISRQIKKIRGTLISKVGNAVTAPVTLAAVPAGFVGSAIGQINPFKDNPDLSGDEQFIELLREKEKTDKQIIETKGIIQTIQSAFEEELASDLAVTKEAFVEPKSVKVQENKVIPVVEEAVQPAGNKKLTEAEKRERIELKKQIKQLEREMRRRYEEIEDRNEAKNKKLDKLAKLLRDKQNSSLLGPVGGTAKGTVSLVRMFLFGMKDEEKMIYEEAGKLQKTADNYGVQAKDLKDSIELDNIMIEARGREIEVLKQEFEVLKSKADSMDGFAFRSILIDRPGNVIEETVQDASNIIPTKDKKSVLIHRLDDETRKLAELEAKSLQIEAIIKEKTLQAKEVEKKALETAITVPDVQTPAPFSGGAAQQAPDPIPSSMPTISLEAPLSTVKPQTANPSVPGTGAVATISSDIPAKSVKQDEEKTIQPPTEPEVQDEETVKKAKIETLNLEKNDLNLLIQNKRDRILEMREALGRELRSWAEANNIQLPEMGKKQKNKIKKSQKKINRELKDLNKDLAKILDEEKETLEKQRSLYEEKLAHLDKTISGMKKRADDRYELLAAEKETVGRRIEQTSKALAQVTAEENLLTKTGK